MLFATGTEGAGVRGVLRRPGLQAIQRLVRQLPVPTRSWEAILRLARGAAGAPAPVPLTDRLIAWGPVRARCVRSCWRRAKARSTAGWRLQLGRRRSLAEPALPSTAWH
jgi:MoxR-like ATPase